LDPESVSLFNKICRYCALQERSLSQVKKKLALYGVSELISDKLTKLLVEEGFLKNSRYAIAYARGKFRMNKWGKTKISLELKHQGVADDEIKNALAKIDDTEYRLMLTDLLMKKNKTLSGKIGVKKKASLVRFALGKGFESDLVWDIVNKLGH
jgi:regulatory protein